MKDFNTPLEFTVITDTHYYSKKLGIDTPSYNKFNGKSQKLIKDSEEVIGAAFEQIKKSTSNIVLFCGDSTCDGDYDSHKEFVDLLGDLKRSGKRVFTITSTHDYQDDGITKKYIGDEPEDTPAAKREELYEMYKDFGPNEAISIFEESLSYIVDLDENYRLFMLNSDKDGTGKSGFSKECKSWVEKYAELARNEGKRMIAVTHHPLISPSPFYSLIGKNDMMGGHKEIRNWLADIGINLVFSGHTHIHNISYIFSENNNVLYDVSTSALAGYPAYMRNVKIVDDKIKVDSEGITEDVNIDFNGENLREHLANQFFGMIKQTIDAAANSIRTFAYYADAFSIRPRVTFRYGWLIKPFAKLLTKLTIGKVAKWSKKEHGLTPKEYESIKDEKVVDFIISLVMYLYEGDAPYTPDTPQYKITVGFLSIIDSFLNTIHLPLGKFLKDFNNVSDLIIPLLYNSGICDFKAELPIDPSVSDVEKLCKNEASPFEPKSKKGPAILTILILLIIVLIPFIPIILILLLIGFIINRIKYSKEIRG